MKKRGSNLLDKQTQEFLPQRRKDAKTQRSRIYVRIAFLSELSVFAVRMLWFKKHIQQQEN